jgi:hypothetical protein
MEKECSKITVNWTELQNRMNWTWTELKLTEPFSSSWTEPIILAQFNNQNRTAVNQTELLVTEPLRKVQFFFLFQNQTYSSIQTLISQFLIIFLTKSKRNQSSLIYCWKCSTRLAMSKNIYTVVSCLHHFYLIFCCTTFSTYLLTILLSAQW